MKKLFLAARLLVIVSLILLPFLEKWTGNHQLYSSWWFILIWIILLVSSAFFIFIEKRKRKFVALLLWLSFFFIFSGAMITHFTAIQGVIHLRQGAPGQRYYEKKSSALLPLPFQMTLDTFRIVYYAGTTAPADYISHITVAGDDTLQYAVSMNNILKIKGYRFYQSSYDRDGLGTILTIYYNPAGIAVTYSGYLLMLVTMLLLLIQPGGTFRKLLQHPAIKNSAIVLSLLLFSSVDGFAAKTLSREEAALFSDILILHNNRIMPLQTFAVDFTKKLTGKDHYQNYSAEQVLLGWVFYPEEWQYEPMIKIKDKALRKKLTKCDKVRYVDFFENSGKYKLRSDGRGAAISKKIREADEKIQLITMLQSGKILKIFPLNAGENLIWYSPTDSLPDFASENEQLFIGNALRLIYNVNFQQESDEIGMVVKGIKQFQKKMGGAALPSTKIIKAELLYNRLNFTTILYKVNLISGFLLLLFPIIRNRRKFFGDKLFIWIFRMILCLSFLFLTAGVVLRKYISGYFPFSNGYETMLFVSWCAMVLTLIFSGKNILLLTFGFLLSGFALLVASIGELNPQITPLMPVLSSPLLSVHVSLLMFSYALLAFTFMNSLYALVSYPFLNRKNHIAAVRQLIKHKVQTGIILWPAIILLAAGIIAGSVWANISWGSYWSWDPKEVWAFITLLVYTLALQDESAAALRKPLTYHLFVFIAFSTLLMTYFGVEYFFGGLHSYGG